MAAAEVLHPHFLAAKKHRSLIGKGNPLRARLILSHDVSAGILVSDDLRLGQETFVTARVIAVVMGIENVADRQTRHRFHLVEDLIGIPQELVIDQNDAVLRQQHADVAAVPGDVEEVLFHPLNGELRWSLLRGQAGITNGKRPCHSERQY